MAWGLGAIWRLVSKFATQPMPPKPPKKMPPSKAPDRYRNVVFPNATFPDDQYRIVPVTLNSVVKNEYLPALERAIPEKPKGLKLLITAMTHQEGFTKKSRSYRTNNPGNIGNTDSGANNHIPTLEDGIKIQAKYFEDLAAGKKSAYPIGKVVEIKPYYSKEIANNPGYNLPPWLPGYKYLFTGQLDQFIKIYATGARATNSYLNTIVSFFHQNGVTITPQSKLQDIIALEG